MSIRILTASVLFLLIGCSNPPDPDELIPPELLMFPTGSFAYPIGEKEYITSKNDWSDNWYDAQDFGENRHLGEDWNKTTGGDTDCGEPVFSTADGVIVFAQDAGPGWGNVIMIEHTAPDGTKLRSMYAHLDTVIRSGGSVARREQIGTVGNASGRYKCHLHFELRWIGSRLWNDVGPGYSDERHGWIDPSAFIEKTRELR